MSEKALKEIKAEVTPFVDEANAVAIKDAKTMSGAVEMLSIANKNLDRIKEEKEKVLKPLREAAKAEKARWKGMEDVLKVAVETLRSKIGTYQTEEDRKAKEKEEKLAARVAKGSMKAETAIKKMDTVDRPEEKVATMAGSISFRTDKKLKITKEADIPREYLVVDEKKLLTALKAGIQVPGAEIEEVKVPINRR
jgi:hypothetical protein